MLDANRKYIDAAADLLLRRTDDDFHYRISRKRFIDSLATLSAALGRMLDEPAVKQRAAAELNRFTVQNYVLAAHMAALRLLLQRYAENLPPAEVEAALESMFAEVRTSLGGGTASGRNGAGRANDLDRGMAGLGAAAATATAAATGCRAIGAEQCCDRRRARPRGARGIVNAWGTSVSVLHRQPLHRHRACAEPVTRTATPSPPACAWLAMPAMRMRARRRQSPGPTSARRCRARA